MCVLVEESRNIKLITSSVRHIFEYLMANRDSKRNSNTEHGERVECIAALQPFMSLLDKMWRQYTWPGLALSGDGIMLLDTLVEGFCIMNDINGLLRTAQRLIELSQTSRTPSDAKGSNKPKCVISIDDQVVDRIADTVDASMERLAKPKDTRAALDSASPPGTRKMMHEVLMIPKKNFEGPNRNDASSPISADNRPFPNDEKSLRCALACYGRVKTARLKGEMWIVTFVDNKVSSRAIDEIPGAFCETITETVKSDELSPSDEWLMDEDVDIEGEDGLEGIAIYILAQISKHARVFAARFAPRDSNKWSNPAYSSSNEMPMKRFGLCKRITKQTLNLILQLIEKLFPSEGKLPSPAEVTNRLSPCLEILRATLRKIKLCESDICDLEKNFSTKQREMFFGEGKNFSAACGGKRRRRRRKPEAVGTDHKIQGKSSLGVDEKVVKESKSAEQDSKKKEEEQEQLIKARDTVARLMKLANSILKRKANTPKDVALAKKFRMKVSECLMSSFEALIPSADERLTHMMKLFSSESSDMQLVIIKRMSSDMKVLLKASSPKLLSRFVLKVIAAYDQAPSDGEYRDRILGFAISLICLIFAEAHTASMNSEKFLTDHIRKWAGVNAKAPLPNDLFQHGSSTLVSIAGMLLPTILRRAEKDLTLLSEAKTDDDLHEFRTGTIAGRLLPWLLHVLPTFTRSMLILLAATPHLAKLCLILKSLKLDEKLVKSSSMHAKLLALWIEHNKKAINNTWSAAVQGLYAGPPLDPLENELHRWLDSPLLSGGAGPPAWLESFALSDGSLLYTASSLGASSSATTSIDPLESFSNMGNASALPKLTPSLLRQRSAPTRAQNVGGGMAKLDMKQDLEKCKKILELMAQSPPEILTGDDARAERGADTTVPPDGDTKENLAITLRRFVFWIDHESKARAMVQRSKMAGLHRIACRVFAAMIHMQSRTNELYQSLRPGENLRGNARRFRNEWRKVSGFKGICNAFATQGHTLDAIDSSVSARVQFLLAFKPPDAPKPDLLPHSPSLSPARPPSPSGAQGAISPSGHQRGRPKLRRAISDQSKKQRSRSRGQETQQAAIIRFRRLVSRASDENGGPTGHDGMLDQILDFVDPEADLNRSLESAESSNADSKDTKEEKDNKKLLRKSGGVEDLCVALAARRTRAVVRLTALQHVRHMEENLRKGGSDLEDMKKLVKLLLETLCISLHFKIFAEPKDENNKNSNLEIYAMVTLDPVAAIMMNPSQISWDKALNSIQLSEVEKLTQETAKSPSQTTNALGGAHCLVDMEAMGSEFNTTALNSYLDITGSLWEHIKQLGFPNDLSGLALLASCMRFQPEDIRKLSTTGLMDYVKMLAFTPPKSAQKVSVGAWSLLRLIVYSLAESARDVSEKGPHTTPEENTTLDMLHDWVGNLLDHLKTQH
ncbi:hypothetical protein AAMO2058_000899500, partial [Amorphochlora amoebiformis]